MLNCQRFYPRAVEDKDACESFSFERHDGAESVQKPGGGPETGKKRREESSSTAATAYLPPPAKPPAKRKPPKASPWQGIGAAAKKKGPEAAKKQRESAEKEKEGEKEGSYDRAIGKINGVGATNLTASKFPGGGITINIRP